jgi:hypothetical protein
LLVGCFTAACAADDSPNMAEDGTLTVPKDCKNGAAIVRTDKLIRRQQMTNTWTVFIIFPIKIGYYILIQAAIFLEWILDIF